MEILIIVIIIAYVIFHLGHSRKNYRHARAHGHRGIGLIWYAGRGPWVSLPGPFGSRITHKL
jgi:hypothetical protein